MKNLSLAIFTFFYISANAQFAPPAGQTGSSAMYKDSSAFIGWATGCNVNRGYQNIADELLGKASVGDSAAAIGKAGDAGVVSLGDGGEALLTFYSPIYNGPGNDFAVFENGFSDTFLELAFVEVSSDGTNFHRFNASSLSDTLIQYDNAASMDATKINNLAGKYRALYGTPFDLEELKDISGLDVNNVTHIKIIDVIGSLDSNYATRDFDGRKINDPWPTPFASSGFDLDAIGVIHQTIPNGIESKRNSTFIIYPNPVAAGQDVRLGLNKQFAFIKLMDLQGRIMFSGTTNEIFLIPSEIAEGLYVISIKSETEIIKQKLYIK